MADMKIVYVITKSKDGGKSFWNRIGSAFVNKDGSINVKFDALPVSGECQIRDYVPREEQASKRSAAESRYDDDGTDAPF